MTREERLKIRQQNIENRKLRMSMSKDALGSTRTEKKTGGCGCKRNKG